LFPLKISLLPFGTAGDVLPFVWLARHLIARGHEVTLITSSLFQKSAKAAGVPFIPIGQDADFELLMRDPRIWKLGTGTKAVFDFATSATALYWQALQTQRRTHGRPDLLLAPVTAFGARLAREKWGVPLVTVHLQPAVIISAYQTPVLFPAIHPLLQCLPPTLKRLLFDYGPNPVDLFAGRALRQLCRQNEVSPPRSFFREWWDSPDGSLLLFPAWFAPPQPDWPKPHLQSTFPLEDLSTEFGLSPALSAFLDQHPDQPPIVFTAGSGNVQAHQFFASARAALDIIKQPGVFVTRDLSQLPTDLPPSIHAAEFTPFSPLLRRAAAFVHHGGIGTLSQGFRAAVPQLIMPMAHDQPDNAARLTRIGAGSALSPARFTPDRVAAALNHLLHSPAVRQRCQEVAQQIEPAKQAPPHAAIWPWLETIAAT